MRPQIYSFILFSFLSLFFGCYKSTHIKPYPVTHLSMASQGPKDLSYTTAGILGQVFNKKSKTHHLKITIEPLLNSFHTIQSVMKGETQFGIVGADKQYEAYTGIGDWEKIGSQKNLRSIFSLYDKPLTLLTTLKTRIKDIGDLKSKKVALGEKESPLLRHVRNVLNLYNIQESEFQSHFFPNNEVSGKLQDEVVDAFFHIGHQPSNVIRNLSNKGRLKYKMLSFNGPEFETFVENHPYYTKSKIPKNLYPNLTNNSDIDSLGIKTTLVTSSKIPDHVVYYLTKELFENMELLKSHFAPYSNLNEEDLFKGLSVPLHPGAIKYLKENGLLEFVDKKLI